MNNMVKYCQKVADQTGCRGVMDHINHVKKDVENNNNNILYIFHTIIMTKLIFETKMSQVGCEKINTYFLKIICDYKVANGDNTEIVENPIDQSKKMLLWNFIHWNDHFIPLEDIIKIKDIIKSKRLQKRWGTGKPTTFFFIDFDTCGSMMEPFFLDGFLHIGSIIPCVGVTFYINSNGEVDEAPEIEIGFFDFLQGFERYYVEPNFFFPDWHFNKILSKPFRNKTKIVQSHQSIFGWAFFIDTNGSIDWTRDYYQKQDEPSSRNKLG